MKITNSQSGAMNTVSQDQPLELRKGETYQAIVKENKSANEAVVQVRGKEVSVKSDGPFPAAGETVSLTIQGQDADGIKVKVADAGIAAASSSGTAAAGTGSATAAAGSDLYTQDDGQVAKLLADKGIPLTRETAGEIQQFMETAPGTVEEKLDSLRALLRKGLEVTDEQLQAVHQALHGEPLSAQLDRLVAAAKAAEAGGAINAGGATDAELRRLVGELRKQAEGRAEWEPLLRQLTQKLLASSGARQAGASDTAARLADALRLLKAGQSGEAARVIAELLQNGAGEGNGLANGSTGVSRSGAATSAVPASAAATKLSGLIEMCQTETSLSHVVYEIKDQLLGSPSVPDERKGRWEQTISSVRREQLAGRTEEARRILNEALQSDAADEVRAQKGEAQSSLMTNNQAAAGAVAGANPSTAGAPAAASDAVADDGPSLSILASRLSESAGSDAYDLNSELASLGLSAKTMIVTQVTARLSQAANEFRSLKREISRNMDNLTSLTETNSKAVLPQAKALLESSIDLLDKAILKSDITMLTDMGTEKRLLQASGQLANARKQLIAGNTDAARDLFTQVKTNLDSLNWKPADVKVRHLLTGESDVSTAGDYHKLSAEWDKLISLGSRNDGSARQTYEAVRTLGLNRDSEAAQWLASGSGSGSSGQGQGHGQSSRDSFDQNIKSILLKLAQDDSSPAAKQAETALQSLTGQQLLSKADTGSPTQSLMFQLPVQLPNQVAPVNVFVQSRKEGEKMDWENCSLYFALETKKLGSLGIQISASDRNLSINVKNDRQDFKQLMEPLVTSCKQKLQEIGYRVSQISYSPLTVVPESGSAATDPAKPAAPLRVNAPSPAPAKGFDFKI